jgi:Sulfotransferase family
MDAVTPLFIFGMGRSGTTNAQRVANAHPLVMLNGEITLTLLKQFLALLDAADRVHEGARGEAWLERKADYIFESFGYLSKGGRGKLHRRADARYMGHKTPRLESLFDEYEAHFGSAGLKPRYFYCARNPFDCWRSYRAAEWNRYDVQGFLAHYVKSFERLDEIQTRVPDRIGVLNLDELIAKGDPVAFYREKLFEPLGLDVPERVVERVRSLSSKRTSGERPPEIGADDRRAIETYPGIARIHAAMFEPHLRDRKPA